MLICLNIPKSKIADTSNIHPTNHLACKAPQGRDGAKSPLPNVTVRSHFPVCRPKAALRWLALLSPLCRPAQIERLSDPRCRGRPALRISCVAG